MAEHDDDLRAIFRAVAERAGQPEGAEARLLIAARRRRLMTAAAATLSVVLLIGGVAGASMLWQPDERTPARPAHSDCPEAAPYDMAVYLPDEATEQQVDALREELAADVDVEGATFISKEVAFREFKAHYRDQPEFWENLPADALPMSFRVRLLEGADSHAAKQRFAALAGIDAVRLYSEVAAGNGASACPRESGPTFARFFFEASEGSTSADGILEVGQGSSSICVDVALTGSVTASHLHWTPKGEGEGGEITALTFFEPDGSTTAPQPPDAFTGCFRDGQLEELEGRLDVLIEQPERFRIDFHRGPEDDPSLTSTLQGAPQPKQKRADYYIEESRGFGVHLPDRWQVARRSLTPTLGDPREILSLGTAPLPAGGRCAHQPGRALEALGPRDAFISIQERRGDAGHPARPRSFQDELEDVVFNIEVCADLDDVSPYWFAFSDAGRDFHLLAALGTEASAARKREFWKVLDSLDFKPPYDDQP